jgi:hypothetical protein
MNVRGRVRALREFRTGFSVLTVLKIHEYLSLQLKVKGHISVFRLYRLFSCSRYSLFYIYYCAFCLDARLLEITSVASICRRLHAHK